MEFKRITSPSDPHAFLPVVSLMAVALDEFGFLTGRVNAGDILRGASRRVKGGQVMNRNGLPMLGRSAAFRGGTGSLASTPSVRSSPIVGWSLEDGRREASASSLWSQRVSSRR